MKVNTAFFQRMLLVCAVLFVFVALQVALGVIPPVKADTYPGVNHGQVAATAFWVITSLNLLSAFSLFFIAIRSKERSWISTAVLLITGFLVLILGLPLADAASAYQKHGPSMQSASTLLFICAAVDFLGGATVIAAAFLRPKKTV